MIEHSFQQGFDGSCGPASLKIALAHLGIEKSEKELIKQTRCSENGIELETLQKIAKKFGIKGTIKKNSNIAQLEKFLKKDYAIIVDWFNEGDGHYSVIARKDRENIYLQDPELGHLRAMRVKKFRRVWFDFSGDYIKTKNDLQLRKMLVLHK